MKYPILGAMALMASCLFAPTQARADSVYLECTDGNYCYTDRPGPAHDRIEWAIDPQGTDAVIPYNCTNKYSCSFYCPRRGGLIKATVGFYLNHQATGTATTTGPCY
ncbi:hypothetical protein [Luteimonas aquatica]|uniref:hypothetical protein n=1 Tax=Luteimonas aquatica TaxID=450364 RepID=UPI001F58C119|nr:hypothetical protein [Luteimonas aquatica]